MPLRVDAERMRADFEALSSFGATPDGGGARTPFSEPHLAVRAWFLERGRESGLETHVDSAANHSVVLPASEPGARTLMLGSHLDSVRRGGRYDGALGVLCALEVVRTVQDCGLSLPVALEAVDFTDEEGTLIGLLGSWAMAGILTKEILAAPRGGRDVLVSELDRMGLTEDGLIAARRAPETLAGYLELHIEQGPVLERAEVDIGVVTGIIGSASFSVVFSGEARHAGTTPMDARRDAALGAAAFVLGVRETVVTGFPGCVATVGNIETEPGSFNVVPGRASLRLECRSLDHDEQDALEDALTARARAEAERHGLEVTVERLGRWEPAPTDVAIQEAFERAAAALGLTSMRMPSGAGHDAQALAAITPAGMVFVPSEGGVSHDPSEHTRWEDCVNGANVLLNAAVELARAAV